MKKKHLLILVIFIISLFIVSCSSTEKAGVDNSETTINQETTTLQAETTTAQAETTQQITETESESNDIAGELIFAETISINPELANCDEDKVKQASDKGLETPVDNLDIYKYLPLDNDTIKYSSQNDSFEIVNPITHNGFDGLKITYDKDIYEWDESTGELIDGEPTHSIEVSLKGNNIYEYEIVPDIVDYYRYYDENKKCYFEKIDDMQGIYGPNGELANVDRGFVTNYSFIESLDVPTYNPLVLKQQETKTNAYVTSLNDKPTLYFETIHQDKLHKKWVDIKHGVLVKELIFNDEGLILEKTVATNIMEENISDAVFKEPEIAYMDDTLFKVLENGDSTVALEIAYYNLLGDKIGLELNAENQKIILYSTGVDQEMVGNWHLDDAMYISYHTNKAGETSRIRDINNGRHYTIHDGLKKMEIYDQSIRDQKFFDIDETALLNVQTENNQTKYTFYDPNNLSVNGLYDVYQYVVEDGEFTAINCYSIEDITDMTPVREVTTYKIKVIPFDETVYDDSYLTTYEKIDHGERSINDGEYMPFWWEQ